MEVIVKDLTRHFGKTRAVDGISFAFESGMVVGFVGPNGAGKTTAMRILATLDEPTGGDASFDGVSAVEYPEKVRRVLGFMPDDLPTHADMTAHEYLDFFARAYGIGYRERRRRVESVESFTNLMGIRQKRLKALSKGMKQRVSLARALVHDPEVLVMDEPAAGLDPRARVELRELLKLLAEQGKAILISSHILTELAEICNGAVIIERGKLLKAGPIETLMGDGAGRVMLVIRPLERVEELHRELLQLPMFENVRRVNGAVETELAGSQEACADLLAELVGKGYRIAEFTQRRAHLEELFMRITKGDVQ